MALFKLNVITLFIVSLTIVGCEMFSRLAIIGKISTSQVKESDKDSAESNLYIIKIINTVAFFYGVLISVVAAAVMSIDRYWELFNKGSFMLSVSAILFALYLGATIATCVYAFKLPETDNNNETLCDCEFEKYTGILRTFSVLTSISVGICVIIISYLAYTTANLS